MRLRIADIVDDSIVDGPGFRITVFAQGCPHRCPGCHNPGTHDFSGGKEIDVQRVLELAAQNPLLSGITLSGGEPFCQPEAMAELAKGARAMGLHVMAYSGWTFEELLQKNEVRDLLESLDVLVDGRFVQEERSLKLAFRGSRNQRIVDVPASLQRSEAVVLNWDE